jgi:predicted aspartyl protease
MLLALSACAEIAEGPCGQTPRAVVPVELADGIPVVQMTINERPARMILDTGAQTFVLTETAVARLELATHTSVPIDISGTGGSSRRFAAVMRGIELAPGFRLPDTYAAVIPRRLPEVGGIPVDGLLGVGVLNRWEIDLDLPASRMVLHEGRACSGPPAAFGSRVTEFKNIATQGGRFAIPVTLDDRRLVALLDTGAQSSIVGIGPAAARGVTQAMLDADPEQKLTGVGADVVQARRHRFRELRIGDDIARLPVLTVTPQNLGPNEGIIGFDYLVHRRLWLSAARNLVFIRQGDAP